MLAAEELDFVDLGALLGETGRAEKLEHDLEATRRQLRQAQLALRAARGGEGDQTMRELRKQVRQLTADNQTLRSELDARTEELEEWQAAHSALDTTLRQTAQERLHLRSKLRQKQMEMDQFLGEVRGMINVTSRLSSFVASKTPSA